MYKVIFFGTPDFVIPIADSILNTKNFNLTAVVTNPDRPVGRIQILTPSPVKSWAKEQKITIIDSTSMIYIIEVIKDIRPDLGILAAYGKIIPKEVIDLFPKGILVIHPSLLPKYRGASPIQAAILSGDKETGVTIIQMDEKMDHGPILARFKEKILENDTTGNLTKRLFDKTARILSTVVNQYIEQNDYSSNEVRSSNHSSRLRSNNNIQIFSPPQPQEHSKATYTKLIIKEDGFIPPEFLKAAFEGKTLKKKWFIPFFPLYTSYDLPATIYNLVRAMSPWPGCWTYITLNTKNKIQKLRLKILKCHLKVLSVGFSVLSLDMIQLEGKNPISWEGFKKGYPEVKFTVT